MKDSKKVYLKAYTRKNLGDDLFIHIICNKYPKHTFYLKEKEGYTNVFENISNLVITNDMEDITFDAIVYIGGSIFIESSEESKLRVLQLKSEIIKNNIPTYIIGANFGPYKTEQYFDIVKKEIISNVKAITFRDTYSYNLFKELPNVYYAPDVVFSLNADNIEKKDKKEIGISIIHHLEREDLKKNYSKYIDKLAEMSKHYIKLGYTVRFFSFCRYEKDMEAVKDVLKKFDANELDNVYISDYSGDMNDMLKDIANLKLFVTTRFHSMVLGLKLNIPIIPICYTDKVKWVLDDIGFAKNKMYDFNTLDSLNYKQIPDVFVSEIFKNSAKQFKPLDEFLKIK